MVVLARLTYNHIACTEVVCLAIHLNAGFSLQDYEDFIVIFMDMPSLAVT